MTTPRLYRVFMSAVIGAGLAGSGIAQEDAVVLVNSDITTATTWTKNNTYNLQKQIFVNSGATLTIEAGTKVISTANIGGSLAVARGAQIFVQGTHKEPVVMTSTNDNGTWREAANEWGNLTVMGEGYISSCVAGNTASCSASNVHPMEGLVANPLFPGRTEYGGDDDDDDSGSISYLSLRFGGKVIGLGNELNGLSLGGIGRETDIHHVEVMNNVDDGIEIWGGTMNLKYFSIWNIGDDSLDFDQGWRGKAQFGLIVQGYSLDTNQGGGVGDNAIEHDGAEGSDYQPVTTVTMYNLTVIGQPLDGDGLTAWRDNARVQYRNCIFMDGGEKVILDDLNGDHACGGLGYGFNGTLGWPATWQTAYTATSTVNPCPDPSMIYQAQTSGMLAEMTDSVFYNNNAGSAYTEAENIGQGNWGAASGFNIFTASGNNNVKEPASSPITSITRGGTVVKGGKAMQPVTALDPRPANDALSSVNYASGDSFFSAAKYRGAFAPGNNWLCGWSASSEFGFITDNGICDLGKAKAGVSGDPVLAVSGSLADGMVTIELSNARPDTRVALTFNSRPTEAPATWSGRSSRELGESLRRRPVRGPRHGVYTESDSKLSGDGAINGVVYEGVTDGNGELTLTLAWPSGLPAGATSYLQYLVRDVAAVGGVATSNLVAVTQP